LGKCILNKTIKEADVKKIISPSMKLRCPSEIQQHSSYSNSKCHPPPPPKRDKQKQKQTIKAKSTKKNENKNERKKKKEN